MLATSQELKNIVPGQTLQDDEKQLGIQAHLVPVATPCIPETIEELEYGPKKNATALIGKSPVGTSVNLPTGGTCNFIFDPRYLSKEELAHGNFRITSEMM